jgi:hypothetical protein
MNTIKEGGKPRRTDKRKILMHEQRERERYITNGWLRLER